MARYRDVDTEDRRERFNNMLKRKTPSDIGQIAQKRVANHIEDENRRKRSIEKLQREMPKNIGQLAQQKVNNRTRDMLRAAFTEAQREEYGAPEDRYAKSGVKLTKEQAQKLAKRKGLTR